MTDRKLSRRRFLRSSAIGASATLAAPAFAQSTLSQGVGTGGTPPVDIPVEPTGRPQPILDGNTPRPSPPEAQVKWAVLGLGHYAQNYAIPGIEEGIDSRLTGLISGNPDKLAQVGYDWGVPEDNRYSYAMEGLAENDEIDVVYVITPNAIHPEMVERAAEAGKHIFCEKPMAASVEGGQRMIDACNANGVKFGMAYRAHFEPHNVKAKEMIDAGDLGRIEFVSSDHHRPLDPGASRDQWRMIREIAGGGSVPDIGIYALNGLIWFLDETPSRLVAQTYSPEFEDNRFAEVEAICNVLLEFPSGKRGQISSGYIASKKRIDVWGADGVAVLDPATSYQGNLLTLSTSTGTETITTDYPTNRQFWGEIDHFSRHIRDDEELRITPEMGIRDLRIIEAIYASAERGAWVDLNEDGSLSS